MPLYFGVDNQFTIMLLIAGMVIMGVVQSYLRSTYAKYSKIQNNRNITGMQVARRILDSNNLQKVEIYQGEGMLSDYFDPTKQLIKLSPEVYNGTSIASLAVAAHEVGHAIQHDQKYPAIGLRNLILPYAIQAGNLAWIVILIGFIFAPSLLWVGIGLIGITALFQLATLPLEFNASNRAIKILEGDGFLDMDEIEGAKKVLNAAALTYVAALIATLFQLLRLVLIARDRD